MFSLLHFKNITTHLPPHTIYCHLLVTSTTNYLKLPAPSGCIKLKLYSCIKTEAHDTFALVLFSVSTNMIEAKSFCNFWNPNVFKPWVQLLPSLPQGFGYLGLGLDFGVAVWPQARQLGGKSCVRKSHEKWGLTSHALHLCLAGLHVSCPGQPMMQWCWCPSATDWYGALNSQLTADLAQVKGLWGPSLAMVSPSLPALLSSSAAGSPCSLEQPALATPWWQSAVSSAAWLMRIESLPWLHPWGIMFQITAVCSP